MVRMVPTRRSFGNLAASAALLLAVAPLACFEDVGVGEASTGSAQTDVGEASTVSSGVDATESSAGGCQGCIDAAGACHTGNVEEACGVLGQACAACDGGTQCVEGECLVPPACSPESCRDGCCDGDDCIAGTNVAACGAGGAQCSVCPSEATCEGGVCKRACGDTCAGCCDDAGGCIEPSETSAAQCGAQGDACVGCGPDFECNAGVCISAACAAECDGCCDGSTCVDAVGPNACGSGGNACVVCSENSDCTASGCAPIAASLWDIVVIDAAVAPTTPAGSAWDILGGAPDPYVEAVLGERKGETSTQDDTLFPVWEEAILESVPAEEIQAGWAFTMYDEDSVFDELMLACEASIPAAAFGEEQTLSCSAGQYEAWTLTFVVIPSSLQ